MIEPNYNTLSTQQLRELCDERKIRYDFFTPFGILIDCLTDDDYEKSVSQLNPE